MDDKGWLGSFGNSSVDGLPNKPNHGNQRPQGHGRPELQFCSQDFFLFMPSVLLSIFTFS